MGSLEKPNHPNIKTRKPFPHFTMKLLLKKVSFSTCIKEMYCSQEEALFL